MPGKNLNLRHSGLLALFTALLAVPPAFACGPEALGTHRVMAVGMERTARFGTKSYERTLPLGPKEVVLTFDDGPLPGPTDAVLDVLRKECVRATFFLIGRNAAANPGHVRRIAADGHTLANHSMTHPWTMRQMAHDAAWKNILDGQTAIEAAAGRSIAPFFRFPGFADTPALLEALGNRRIAVFGTDLWASDWNVMRAETQLALVLGRLRKANGGIILFHDTKRQTAEMLPGFLAALRKEGFRVVHIVPK
ncbi:MAG: polysaccharide [Beijerinckiaceae bacterium]|nr:MAG: polysaccharide [Beijerinckiaceae bacterium]